MLYIIYNEHLQEFSTVYSSLLSLTEIYRYPELYFSKRIKYNMTLNSLFLLYNALILACMICIIMITISTFVFLFKKSSAIEIEKDNDEMMNKLKDIDFRLDKISAKKKSKTNNNTDNDKQYIWLCLTNNNDLFNEKCVEHHTSKMLLFTSSHQIISFLKYLFAIKPKLQFKKLDKKFVIVIECNVDKVDPSVKERFLNDYDLEQIDTLFDWLNFAGCKISVVIYTDAKLEKNLSMSISTNYWNVKFIYLKKEFNKFFQKDHDDNDSVANIKNDIPDNKNLLLFNRESLKEVSEDEESDDA
jgi:hypothetical protein